MDRRRNHLVIFAHWCRRTLGGVLRSSPVHWGTRGRERLSAARRDRNATSGWFRWGNDRRLGGSRKRRKNGRMIGPRAPCIPEVRRTSIPRESLIRCHKADRQTTRWCGSPSCWALPPRPSYTIHTHYIGNPSTSSTCTYHALQPQVTARFQVAAPNSIQIATGEDSAHRCY